MCLDTVTKSGLNESGIGYKVFRQERDGKLRTLIYDFGGKHVFSLFGGSDFVKLNHEYTDVNRDIVINESHVLYGYPSGFHIFKNKRMGMQWAKNAGWSSNTFLSSGLATRAVIAKVKYSDCHTMGTQDGNRVAVADKMTITEIVGEIK